MKSVKNFIHGILLIMAMPVLANQNKCTSEIIGYKVLEESVYPCRKRERLPISTTVLETRWI